MSAHKVHWSILLKPSTLHCFKRNFSNSSFVLTENAAYSIVFFMFVTSIWLLLLLLLLCLTRYTKVSPCLLYEIQHCDSALVLAGLPGIGWSYPASRRTLSLFPAVACLCPITLKATLGNATGYARPFLVLSNGFHRIPTGYDCRIV